MKSLPNIARKIAEKVHLEPNEKYPGGQTDKKGFPYMAHINDVASRVAHLGESYEIVGLLHDSIEDAHNQKTKLEIENLISSNFESEIIEAIDVMTKSSNEDYFSEYLPRVRKNKIALMVKIADSSHNLSKAYLIEDKIEQEKLRQKYIKVLDFLGVDGSKQEKKIFFVNGKWKEKI